MGLGRRKRERQREFWVAADALPDADTAIKLEMLPDETRTLIYA